MKAPYPLRGPFAALSLSLTLTGLSYAGTFSSDFSSTPGGATAYGSAFVDGTALELTPALTSQQGSFVIDDLDPGLRVLSFDAVFKLHMGNGTATPGDGICFVFGTDVPNTDFNEEGQPTSGPGTSGLVVTFDAYDNSNDNNAEGPEFRIKYNNTLIARRKLSNQLNTGTGYVPVEIHYAPAGTLTLVYNNTVMFTNLFVFGALPTGARFGFGARCGGGADQEQFIDDLSINTTTVSTFYVKNGVTPYPPVGTSGAVTFQVPLQDSGGVVDPNSVTMTFNGSAVSPSVSKPAGVTTISYTPKGALLPSSVNHIAVNLLVSGTPTTLLYDIAVTNGPLWSLAPLSRPYLPLDTDLVNGTTPLYRSIALNPVNNHLYVVSRTGAATGLSVNVLDAKTGADLHQMNTTGIGGGSIILLSIAVADDGAIYGANMSGTANSPLFNVYRWANDSSGTVPTVVYSGDPGATITPGKRWGDTLAARGSGLNTQLIVDCNANPMSALLTPTDTSWVSNFVLAAYSDTYATAGTAIGRTLQFGPTNTFWLKKRSTTKPGSGPVPALPLVLFQNNAAPATTLLVSVSPFYGEVGPLTLDFPRNLAAGIMFVTNAASADHLVVYDISNLASPLQLAQYDFPVLHQTNNNYIGQVVIGTDQIYAVDGNNGIMAVPIVPPSIPTLQIAAAGSSAVLSWSNTVPGFVLQSTTNLAAPLWSPVSQPVVEGGLLNSVTDTPTSPTFYRLVK